MFRIALLCIVLATPAAAQSGSELSIRKVLADQAAAWNRGDIEAFMQGYENSPETTFVGKTVQHGWRQVLDNYRSRYATRAAMGRLDFSELSVKMLGTDYASVLGKFHLTRTAEGGGEASGLFSLIFRRAPGGWKIILDHTS
ncbi:MAG: L-asparaginase [Bryobacterales bacterium]|nr:L-asparaginase [Bryobacterales bacterium]